MPQRSRYENLSCLALIGLAATILTLPSCSGETQDLNDQGSTATTKQLSAGAAKAAHGGMQPTGDTIQETITATGDELKNNYQTIATVISAPDHLSDLSGLTEINTDRDKFLAALKDYQHALTSYSNTQAKFYCFDNEIRIYEQHLKPDRSTPCRFLYELLTPHNASRTLAKHSSNPTVRDSYNYWCHDINSPKIKLCKHSAFIKQSKYRIEHNYHPYNSASHYFWGNSNTAHFGPPAFLSHSRINRMLPIHEPHRLRVILDTLAFFDKSNTYKPATLRVFRSTDDNNPILRVMLNLAFTDTKIEPEAVSGSLIDTYGSADDLQKSFLFFSLLNAPRPKLQAITSHLGGQAFVPALGVNHPNPSAANPHPITSAMQTITHSTKVYAQGTKLITKQPVAKINSIIINDRALSPDDYAVVKSAIYVEKHKSPQEADTIKVEYIATATP